MAICNQVMLIILWFFFLLHSKLEESDKKNQDLQAEIQMLKQETESLRTSKGKNTNIWNQSGKILVTGLILLRLFMLVCDI